MAAGMYRTEEGWVQVNYGSHSAPIPRARYEENGYKPDFDDLPAEADYLAARKKPQDNA